VSEAGWIYALATLAGAVGLWLLLPRGRAAGRTLGLLFAVASLSLFGSRVPWIGDWLRQSTFLVLAGVTVVSAIGAITFRNPVYCAVWFGLTLLGTAGLMLWQGSQFLAVATIVVYAGAILVTLLFVLMLANPAGSAAYDRTSWEAPLAATVGMVIVGVLTITLHNTPLANAAVAKPGDRAGQILQTEHVARLGSELFSRHLLAVELAGTLLLVALVGAVAIVVHTRGARRSEPSGRPDLSIADAGGARHG
jgi:NADH-quinone oxidoreductase subunit J